MVLGCLVFNFEARSLDKSNSICHFSALLAAKLVPVVKIALNGRKLLLI